MTPPKECPVCDKKIKDKIELENCLKSHYDEIIGEQFRIERLADRYEVNL